MPEDLKNLIRKNKNEWIVILFIFLGLFYLVNINYILFHSVSEVISVVISIAVFFVIWHTSFFFKNSYLQFIGFGSLFSAIFDTFHFLSYKGMGVMSNFGGENLSTQLWISARYIFSLSLLIGIFYINKKIDTRKIFLSYLTITTLLILSIFKWKVFPTCYIIGSGLTTFKIFSEYIIIFILIFAFTLLQKNKKFTETPLALMLSISLLLTALSELMFTFYFNVYDTYNFFGHILKTLSSFFIYKGVYDSINPLFEKTVEFSQKMASSMQHRYLDKTMQLKENLSLLENYKYCIDKSAIVSKVDIEGNILDVNEAFCTISKYSKEELIGQNYKMLNSGHHSKYFFKNFWDTILSGEIFRGEICNKAKDGTLFWMYTVVVPFLDRHGKIYQFITIRQDITELIKKRQELSKAQKFSTIGELSAEILHDAMSPLSVIKTSSTLLKKVIGTENENYNIRFEKIDRSVEKIEKLFSDLRKFLIRPENQQVTPEERACWETVSLSNIISTAENNSRLSECTLLFYNNVKESAKLKCLPNQLTEVFINLINNSIAATKEQKNRWINISSIEAEVEQEITIVFTDSGKGISPEIETQMFDSLFTTKKDDGGTGLGLSVCKRIIEFHGGIIRFNRESENTQFLITLPKN